MLYLGTMFAPIKDRDEPGKGFTHKIGDIVTDLDAEARHARQPGDDLATRRRPGRSASAHLMRNLAAARPALNCK